MVGPHAFDLSTASDRSIVYRAEAVQLATLVEQVALAKQQGLRELQRAFQQHPDAAIFEPLPDAGDVLAPALFAQLGDDRQRFPTPASVQALAGTGPVTESSGKHRVVHIRRGCNREFRYVAQQFALSSRTRSVWAAAYYEQVRPHCRSDNQACR